MKFSGMNIVNVNGSYLKPYHHIKLDKEFRIDCTMWEIFLLDMNSVIGPFINLDNI